MIVGHVHSVDCIVPISLEQRLIATGSQGESPSIRVWHIDEGVCIATFKGHRNTISSIVGLGQGERIASASHDGSIKFWSLKTRELDSDVDAHGYPVLCMIKSQDEQVLVSGGDDWKVKVWRAETGEMEKEGVSTRGYIQSLSWIKGAEEDRLFASGLASGHILIWDLKDLRKELRVLDFHSQPVLGIVEMGNRIVSVAEDRDMVVWEHKEGGEKEGMRFDAVRKPHKNMITGLVVQREKGLVATAGREGTVKIWKLKSSE